VAHAASCPDGSRAKEGGLHRGLRKETCAAPGLALAIGTLALMQGCLPGSGPQACRRTELQRPPASANRPEERSAASALSRHHGSSEGRAGMTEERISSSVAEPPASSIASATASSHGLSLVDRTSAAS